MPCKISQRTQKESLPGKFQGRFVGFREGIYFSDVLESNELGIIHQELVIKHEVLSLMNQALKDAPMHHCQISKI